MHALAETGLEADSIIPSVIPTMTLTVQAEVSSIDWTATAVTSRSHETGGIDVAPSVSGGNGVDIISCWVWWFNMLGSFRVSWKFI